MERLTASVARGMMPDNVPNFALNWIDELIENAAKNNQSSIRMPPEFVTFDSTFSPEWEKSPLREIAEDLRSRGFLLRPFYEDGFFTNMGVTIEW